jgi:hypothetical protein
LNWLFQTLQAKINGENSISLNFYLIYKEWSKLFVRVIRNNFNQVVHTLV